MAKKNLHHGKMIRRLVLLLLFMVLHQASLLESHGTAGEEDGGIYVSIVMVGRHDDERGDYTGRIQNSLDILLNYGMELSVRMEIIIVEWNALPGSARFAELLRVPPDCGKLPVRVIAVDEAFHNKVVGHTNQSFFEFMAKNVGARRSRGRFVLFTNGDIVLNRVVMHILAAQSLDENAFYRIERTEIPGLLDTLAPLEARKEVTEELLALLNPKKSCPVGEKECPGSYNHGICEKLSAAAKASSAGGDDEASASKDRLPNREQQVVQEAHHHQLGEAHYYDEGHKGLVDKPFLPAAGDFFLISRQALHAIGGYHQVPSTTHLDSLLVCKARGAGLRQVVLLRPCYMIHQRHPAPQQLRRYILPGACVLHSCVRAREYARAYAYRHTCVSVSVSHACLCVCVCLFVCVCGITKA
jgi:hypothetical protein